MFELGLKEKMVCHETVGVGRARFQHLSVVSLPFIRGRTLTPVGVGRGWGVVIGSYSIAKWVVSAEPRQCLSQTYVTYSLSFLVVRVSGVLPNRPMRTSFAMSDADGRDDENAYKFGNVRGHMGWAKLDVHATQRVGQEENERVT